MPLPAIEDIEDGIYRQVADILGETIQYAADGANYTPFKADGVEYGDEARDVQTGVVIAQAKAVTVLKADVPGKPNGTARVRLKRAPGLIYRPVNVIEELSGAHWRFEVERV